MRLSRTIKAGEPHFLETFNLNNIIMTACFIEEIVLILIVEVGGSGK